MTEFHRHLLALSAQIVGAHVRHNDVTSDALPDIIRNVYSTLAELGDDQAEVVTNGHVDLAEPHDHHFHLKEHDTPPESNVYVHPAYGQTVFGDHLVCMECGLSMKMLKRHLVTVHALSPDDYRSKWNLPPEYPMVAAEYARLRSSLALESGLGLKPEDRPSQPSRRSRRSA